MYKHTAIDPNGKLHKRNSKTRQYSHVVLVTSSKDRDQKWIDYYRNEGDEEYAQELESRMAQTDYSEFGPVGWCGRLDLAEKRADEARRNGSYGKIIIVRAELSV